MSQENNCAGVSFNKVSGWRLATLFKERLGHLGLVKPIQHFIQHRKMPCWTKCWTGLTEHRNNKKKKKKKERKKLCWMKKNRVGLKFDCDQILHSIFSSSTNKIFLLRLEQTSQKFHPTFFRHVWWNVEWKITCFIWRIFWFAHVHPTFHPISERPFIHKFKFKINSDL